MDCESQRNQLAPIVAEQVFPGNSSRGRIAILCNIAKICSRDEVKLIPSRGKIAVLRYRGSICSRDGLHKCGSRVGLGQYVIGEMLTAAGMKV